MSKQKHTVFLKDKFIEYCNEKFPTDKTNDNILAGECEVNVKTIENWSDPSMGSSPKVDDVLVLVKLADIDFNYFFANFIKFKP